MRNAVTGVRGHRGRGAALIYVIVMLTMFCALASLGVDVGRVWLAKSELDTVAAAAGRAACQALPTGGPAAATAAAVAVAAANKCDGQSVTLDPATDITFVTWDPVARAYTPLPGGAAANANAVLITLSRTAAGGNPIPMTYARVLGKTTCDIHASAIVCSVGNTGAYSLIGVNGVTISGSAVTDSYNSSKGPYKAATAGHKGSMASNGDIKLSGNAEIDGDARAGVGKTTSISGSSSVTGLVAPLGAVLSYPSATLPGSYIDAGDCVMSSGTVHLPGGNYVFGTIDLSGNAHVIWDGPVNLYIRTKYAVSSGVVIDTYGNVPANRVLNFLPTCKTATWTGSNDCVGELYAPDTDLTIGGTVEIYGRVTAKSINLTGNAALHYDEALSPIGKSATAWTISRVQ